MDSKQIMCFKKLFAFIFILFSSIFNPLRAKPTIWSNNTLKQFVDCCQQFVWVCLTILRGWRLKGKVVANADNVEY